MTLPKTDTRTAKAEGLLEKGLTSDENHRCEGAVYTYGTSAASASAAAFACGFIGYTWSERVFWSVWMPTELWLEPAIVWLAYSAISCIFLFLWLQLQPSHWTTVLFTGAVYGWLVEGGLVSTLYGTQPSAPFPASLVITGLSWHAILTIGVGFWGLAIAMQRPSRWPIFWLATLVGIFWGLWGMFPWAEDPPIQKAPTEFFVHSLLCCVGLVVAWSALRWLDIRGKLQPNKTVLGLSIAFISIFYAAHAAILGPIVLLLPLLLVVAVLSGRRAARRQGCTSAAPVFAQLQHKNILCLLWIPFAATLAYVIVGSVGGAQWQIPALVYYWTTGPLATLAMAMAIYKTWLAKELNAA